MKNEYKSQLLVIKKNQTSVIRIFALRASAFRGSRMKSEFVSPVKATSGDNTISVIYTKHNNNIFNHLMMQAQKICSKKIT